MKIELTKEWCMNMAEREAAAGDPDCSAGAPARGLVERLRDSSGCHINGLYDREAADEIERLRLKCSEHRDGRLAALERVATLERRLQEVDPTSWLDLMAETAPRYAASSATGPAQRAMWVVEVLEGTRWRPTEWVGLTRERARDQLRDWQHDGAQDRLRVVRYCPTAA